jgi:hypothetical protein
MNKMIRFIFLAMFSGILFFSCVKKTSKKDTEESLKSAMGQYLNHGPRVDTSRIKFSVLEVAFFEEKMFYVCNFRVNMKQKRDDRLIDTTGSMSANISKDFKDITRTN